MTEDHKEIKISIPDNYTGIIDPIGKTEIVYSVDEFNAETKLLRERVTSYFSVDTLIMSMSMQFAIEDSNGFRDSKDIFFYYILYPKLHTKVVVISAPRYRDDIRYLCKYYGTDLNGILRSLFKFDVEISGGHLSQEHSNLSDFYTSNIAYVFTDDLIAEPNLVSQTFANMNVRCTIIDDDAWKLMTAGRSYDFFLSHDSRDKKEVAEPIYNSLANLGFNVWLDKFAIAPGDDIFEKIDEGLTNAKCGILLLTSNFLKNAGWARRELTTLMNRTFSSTDRKTLIPVWYKIEAGDIMQRSASVANISAVRFEGDWNIAARQIADAYVQGARVSGEEN